MQEDYGGDLRRLREEAGRDPDAERRLLKEFKGLGDVGVDIFREVQVVWRELWPFADQRTLDAAGRLGLGKDAEKLADRVGEDWPRLVAALIRVDLEEGFDEVREAAAR